MHREKRSECKTYPQNLLNDICPDFLKIPKIIAGSYDDFGETLTYVLGRLNAKSMNILMLRYRDGETLRSIASLHGLTQEGVRVNINSSLGKLRMNPNLDILRYGLERWKNEYARHESDCSEDDDECDGLKTSIDALGLQNRTWRCLQKEGILTIEDILDCEFSYLISIRNMGIRSIRDLVEVMESKGYDVSKLMPPATRKYNKAEG